MARAVVLGGGMVGSAMAFDLRRHGHDVLLMDRSEAALGRAAARWGVQTRAADLSDPAALRAGLDGADVVLGALPSVLGLRAAEQVIRAGKRYVDISFLAEDPRALDVLAREHGAVVVYDCGVAPGMSNLLAGVAAHRMTGCERIDILVGGLPVARHAPYEYKAPFAPYDVLEEYTRPARIVEHGRTVVKEALSEPEAVDFPGIGTLEAFNTDGLRSLVDLPVPNLRERTMRYPGHVALMKAFRATGLFSKEPVRVRGQEVVPLDLTAALLFPKWTFEEGEADLTVMRVVADGAVDGRRVRWTWDLDDRYDPQTGLRSMSRTTAFPATIVAGLLLEGRFSTPGVHPPEALAPVPGLLEEVLAAHEARGVHYRFGEAAR